MLKILDKNIYTRLLSLQLCLILASNQSAFAQLPGSARHTLQPLTLFTQSNISEPVMLLIEKGLKVLEHNEAYQNVPRMREKVDQIIANINRAEGLKGEKKIRSADLISKDDEFGEFTINVGSYKLRYFNPQLYSGTEIKNGIRSIFTHKIGKYLVRETIIPAKGDTGIDKKTFSEAPAEQPAKHDKGNEKGQNKDILPRIFLFLDHLEAYLKARFVIVPFNIDDIFNVIDHYHITMTEYQRRALGKLWNYILKEYPWELFSERQHAKRVAVLSVLIYCSIIPPEKRNINDVNDIVIAALGHDLGKKDHSITDLLFKKGPLTKDEKKRMDRHAYLSVEMLKSMGLKLSKRQGTAIIEHSEHNREGHPGDLVSQIIYVSDRIDARHDKTRLYKERNLKDWSEVRILSALKNSYEHGWIKKSVYDIVANLVASKNMYYFRVITSTYLPWQRWWLFFRIKFLFHPENNGEELKNYVDECMGKADEGNTGKDDFGPALFMDFFRYRVRSLSDQVNIPGQLSEHSAVNSVINDIIFNGKNEPGKDYKKLSSSDVLYKYIMDIIPREQFGKDINVYVIKDNRLRAALVKMGYGYIYEGLVTHAGTYKGKAYNIFLPESAYDILSYIARTISVNEHDEVLKEFMDLWRWHELRHLVDRKTEIDAELEKMYARTIRPFLLWWLSYRGSRESVYVSEKDTLLMVRRVIISENFILERKYKEADAMLGKVLSVIDDLVMAYVLKAEMYEGEKRWDEAGQMYVFAELALSKRTGKIGVNSYFLMKALDCLERTVKKKNIAERLREPFNDFRSMGDRFAEYVTEGRGRNAAEEIKYFCFAPMILLYVEGFFSRGSKKVKLKEAMELIELLLRETEAGRIVNPYDPKDVTLVTDIYMMAVDIYIEAGKYEKALKIVDEIKRTCDPPAEFYNLLAFASIITDMRTETVERVKEEVRRVIGKFGNKNHALSDLMRILNMISEEIIEKMELGNKYFSEGKYVECVETVDAISGTVRSTYLNFTDEIRQLRDKAAKCINENTKLNKAIAQRNWKRATRHADNILSMNPGDKAALNAKRIANEALTVKKTVEKWVPGYLSDDNWKKTVQAEQKADRFFAEGYYSSADKQYSKALGFLKKVRTVKSPEAKNAVLTKKQEMVEKLRKTEAAKKNAKNSGKPAEDRMVQVPVPLDTGSGGTLKKKNTSFPEEESSILISSELYGRMMTKSDDMAYRGRKSIMHALKLLSERRARTEKIEKLKDAGKIFRTHVLSGFRLVCEDIDGNIFVHSLEGYSKGGADMYTRIKRKFGVSGKEEDVLDSAVKIVFMTDDSVRYYGSNGGPVNVPGTLKAPFSDRLTGKERQYIKRTVEEHSPLEVSSKALDEKLREASEYIAEKTERVNAPVAGRYFDPLKIPDSVSVYLLSEIETQGIPRFEGAKRASDFIYVYPEVIGGKLRLYMTESFFRDHFDDDTAAMAEILDHEYIENVMGYSHRFASSRARFFARDNKSLSPFHRFFVNMLGDDELFSLMSYIRRERGSDSILRMYKNMGYATHSISSTIGSIAAYESLLYKALIKEHFERHKEKTFSVTPEGIYINDIGLESINEDGLRERIARQIREEAGDDARVLSFGCWTGIFAKTLVGKGLKVDGIAALPEAAEKARGKGINIIGDDADDNFLWSTLEGEHKYDAVIFPESIEYMDTRKALFRAKSVLKPGGKVFILYRFSDAKKGREMESKYSNYLSGTGYDIAATRCFFGENGKIYMISASLSVSMPPEGSLDDRSEIIYTKGVMRIRDGKLIKVVISKAGPGDNKELESLEGGGFVKYDGVSDIYKLYTIDETGKKIRGAIKFRKFQSGTGGPLMFISGIAIERESRKEYSGTLAWRLVREVVEASLRDKECGGRTVAYIATNATEDSIEAKRRAYEAFGFREYDGMVPYDSSDKIRMSFILDTGQAEKFASKSEDYLSELSLFTIMKKIGEKGMGGLRLESGMDEMKERLSRAFSVLQDVDAGVEKRVHDRKETLEPEQKELACDFIRFSVHNVLEEINIRIKESSNGFLKDDVLYSIQKYLSTMMAVKYFNESPLAVKYEGMDRKKAWFTEHLAATTILHSLNTYFVCMSALQLKQGREYFDPSGIITILTRIINDGKTINDMFQICSKILDDIIYMLNCKCVWTDQDIVDNSRTVSARLIEGFMDASEKEKIYFYIDPELAEAGGVKVSLALKKLIDDMTKLGSGSLFQRHDHRGLLNNLEIVKIDKNNRAQIYKHENVILLCSRSNLRYYLDVPEDMPEDRALKFIRARSSGMIVNAIDTKLDYEEHALPRDMYIPILGTSLFAIGRFLNKKNDNKWPYDKHFLEECYKLIPFAVPQNDLSDLVTIKLMMPGSNDVDMDAKYQKVISEVRQVLSKA